MTSTKNQKMFADKVQQGSELNLLGNERCVCVGYACVRACVHDSRDEFLDGTLNIENAITMDCTYIHTYICKLHLGSDPFISIVIQIYTCTNVKEYVGIV